MMVKTPAQGKQRELHIVTHYDLIAAQAVSTGYLQGAERLELLEGNW
jgi:hypothetical protein